MCRWCSVPRTRPVLAGRCCDGSSQSQNTSSWLSPLPSGGRSHYCPHSNNSQLFVSDVTSLSVEDRPLLLLYRVGKKGQFGQPSHLLLCLFEPLLMFLKPLVRGQMLTYSCTALSFMCAVVWRQQGGGLLAANPASCTKHTCFCHPQCSVLLWGVALSASS